MVLERTEKVEKQASRSTSQEMLQMMENTKILEGKQKEYEDWKESMLVELDTKFKAQLDRINNIDDRMVSHNEKLDIILAGMASMQDKALVMDKVTKNSNSLMM
eukprot:7105875-Ditylum_brightwellii.AAC.1